MCRFFKKSTISTLFAIFLTCAQLPAMAAESYLYTGFPDSAAVYRITSDRPEFPTGYVFDGDKNISHFIIDPLRNYRFIKMVHEENFKKSPGYIYRQVFDGLADEADMGQGHAQHLDQRSQLIPDAAGQPVFRPVGAPFSAGPGQLVTEGIALAATEDDEVEKLVDKKWFRIPNGSWYQSWFPLSDRKPASYKIFYDCWEERTFSCVESLWRGFNPGMILERRVGAGIGRQLVRAVTDGAMEIPANSSDTVKIQYHGNCAVFHESVSGNAEGSLLVHTWSGRAPGQVYIDGQPYSDAPAFISQDSRRRFVGMRMSGYARRVYIMGTDILRDWLKGLSHESRVAECSDAVFVNVAGGDQTVVFVYSAPESKIYQFVLAEADEIKLERVLEPGFEVCAMHATANGDLYLATLEKVPAAFAEDEDYAAGFESTWIDEENQHSEEYLTEEEMQQKMAIKKDLTGRLVFSQTVFATLYAVYKNDTLLIQLGRVSLDKIFIARDFSFPSTSLKEVYVNINDLLKMARKPGNTLGEPYEKVPDFPDQYRRPEKIAISVITE